MKVKIGAPRSPNTNAYIERFIQSIGQECLDHFVIFGEKHMDYLCSEYLQFYHQERPHQSLHNEPLVKQKKGRQSKSKCGEFNDNMVFPRIAQSKQRLGGLLRHYYRKAA